MRLDTTLPFLLLQCPASWNLLLVILVVIFGRSPCKSMFAMYDFQLMASCLVQQQHLKSTLNLSFYRMYSHSWEKLKIDDMVWEENILNSLKAMTREKRGKGTRRQVQPETKISGNWKAFLWSDENNMELFCFSGSTVHTNPHWWQSCLNLGHADRTIKIPRENSLMEDINRLSACTHKEADTRLLLHADDDDSTGCKRIMLWPVDIDSCPIYSIV